MPDLKAALKQAISRGAIGYTAAELARAKESMDFWRTKKIPDTQVFALLGCEGGETSFIWQLDDKGHEFTPPGDHGEARGPFQWWPARGNIILTKSGFDVRFGTHIQALEGAYAEMTAAWSAYKHVMPALLAAKTMWGAELELVEYFEQSKNQSSDVVKRVAIAAYLQHELS